MEELNPTIRLTERQSVVMRHLHDDAITEVVAGGAKAGGKTFIGATWVVTMAESYPKTHWFVARKELNDLRKYTRPSIHEIYEKCYGVDWESRAKYNGQDNYYELVNGSKIFLLHAKPEPGDPLYERFGSMQMTGGWIEEAGEFEEMAYANLLISIGRWRNKEYGIIGKLLMTCNPKKNFLYDKFYLPWREGTIAEHRAFVPMLPTHNPHLSDQYLTQLQKLRDTDVVAYERLWLGNWDYSDDDTTIFFFDDINDAFTKKSYHRPDRSDGFITVDPSAQGKDRTVVMVWLGQNWIQEVISMANISSPRLVEVIKTLQAHYGLSNRDVIYDDDGVGNYLAGYLPGAYRFKGGKVPLGRLGRKEYPNLRTECYYLLRDAIRSRSIFINENRKAVRKIISRELSAVKADKVDDDKKKYILKKDDIRRSLGGSPDFADCIMMSRVRRRRGVSKGASA